MATRDRTVGAVCRHLSDEFPDVSISKIRYLEAEGLIRPRRTRSGYRLYSDDDVERLRTVLRLQRDEFLPLKVIREQLRRPGAARDRRPGAWLRETEQGVSLVELCERAQISIDTAVELREHGLLAPQAVDGEPRFTETDVEIAFACGRLLARGLDPKHLRPFRHAADRLSGLLAQLATPALRSRNVERRRSALSDVEALTGEANDLVALLVRRDMRTLADSALV